MTEAERDRMILSLRPSVIGSVNRIFVSTPGGVDREDMINEAWLGAIAAVDGFEPGRGLKLSTFAEFKIRGRVLDLLRRADPLKRAERLKIKRGDTLAPIMRPIDETDIEDHRALTAIADIEARHDVRAHLHRGQLTDRQRFVLRRRYWDGRLDREIGVEIGIGPSAVAQLCRRTISRLRACNFKRLD
jgi:RNA polymerase sigma factor (sigma-70 family)